MPANAEQVAVLRIVVRQGFSPDLTRRFAEDLVAVTGRLHQHGTVDSTAQHFAH